MNTRLLFVGFVKHNDFLPMKKGMHYRVKVLIWISDSTLAEGLVEI